MNARIAPQSRTIRRSTAVGLKFGVATIAMASAWGSASANSEVETGGLAESAPETVAIAQPSIAPPTQAAVVGPQVRSIAVRPVADGEMVDTADTQDSSAPSDEQGQDERIQFAADLVEYDFNADTVSASGNVVVSRDDYRLVADSVRWNRVTGEVVASGNIRVLDPSGNIAYGEEIRLTDELRDGVIDNILLVLDEGGRLVARQGRREDGDYFLEKAAYTACAVEDSNGCPKKPTWQIKADSVRYDPDSKKVRYKGARVELFGLPLVPLPGLSHRIGGEAGSGFLVPTVSYSRNNGVEYVQPYYWRIAPNKDLRVSAHLFSDVAPMASAEYRMLTNSGAFRVEGFATAGSRIDLFGGGTGNDGLRYYAASSGRYQFDRNWGVSYSARYASDRTFLRRYDISRDDRLRSTINVQRIDPDSYFSLTGWYVQTLRVGDVQAATPIALPEIDYRRRIADPLLGGQFMLRANSLAITRTDGQDTRRAFASAQWEKKLFTPLGQRIDLTVLARGDVYNSEDNDLTTIANYRGLEGWQGRGIAAAAVDVRWPFAGPAFGGVQRLTPRVQMVLTPEIENFDVPNEDSRAIDLEDTNLFAINRFPGYDRFEDGPRVTYGLDYSLVTGILAIDANIGQSYRLTERSSILPDGTGLSERLSDVVGRVTVRRGEFISLTNRFRLDKDNGKPRRLEFDATVGSRETYATIAYLRLNRDISGLLEDLADREEVRAGGRAKIGKYWSIFGSAIIDLTNADEDPLSQADGFEPIRTRLGVAYDDECLSMGLTWRRDFEETGDARRGDTFLFRLAFRNLGV